MMSNLLSKLTKFLRFLVVDLPIKALNANLNPIFDMLFLCLEPIFKVLEKFIPYFRKKTLKIKLSDCVFTDEERREYFIPVRRATIIDRLVADAATEKERRYRKVFAEMSAARFQFDFLKRTERLENNFAAFDPDSDAQYREAASAEELENQCYAVFEEMKQFLADSNFFEIPRKEFDACLSTPRPGALPLVALYDDFEEFLIFARGDVAAPCVRYPRWAAGLRFVDLESETLTRVCVLALVKKSNQSVLSLPMELGKILKKQDEEVPESNDASDREIVIKLFKNVALEDLKMIAPRVRMTFPLADKIKTIFPVAGAVFLQAFKILFLTAAPILVLVALILGTIKGAFGFFHRRTAYMQKYTKTLYFKNLASNRAAISLLVQMAQDQEIKEFAIGYFAAQTAQEASPIGWATEQEIDDEAERWLKANFDLNVNFECPDALRKLREKGLVETKVDPNDASRNVYRVYSLLEALRRLDAEWDAFYNFDDEEDDETASIAV